MADLNIGNSSTNVLVNAKHNGSVTPQINNTYDLGTSDLRWKNIYASQVSDWYEISKNNAGEGTIVWNRILLLTTWQGDNPENDSAIEFELDGDQNYTYARHGYLFINSYGATSRSLVLTSSGNRCDVYATLVPASATASGNTYVWLGLSGSYTGKARMRILYNGSKNIVYTSSADRSTTSTAPNTTYITNEGNLKAGFNSTNNTWSYTLGVNSANGNAHTVDGEHSSAFVHIADSETVTGTKTFTGNINIAAGAAGGLINGSATNGGLNSIRIGNDVWLGNINKGGILGLKADNPSTTQNGFWFYNGVGTNIGKLYADGTNLVTNKSFVPESDLSNNLGTTSKEFKELYVRAIAARHLDADRVFSGDHDLYIGYGSIAATNNTKFYYSADNADGVRSRTEYARINNNGLYALTRFGVNGQNTSYNFYVNGTSYFNGNTTHNGIDYFANGTSYYINNSADANLRRGEFAGTSNADTAASNFFNSGAIEIRESGRVGSSQSSFNYAPRIGFHWGNRIAATLSFHSDGIFYLRKQNGSDRATLDANLNGNAVTATISRSLGTDDTMKVYGQYNDEVDFGGTNNSSTIYFGYRAVDSKPIPSKFIFGGNSGTAELIAAKFTGTLNGNANTATKFASAQSITLTGDTTGTASSQAGWSIGTTTYKLTNIGFLDTVEKLDGFIEANKLKYATVGSVGGVNSDGMIISVPWSSSGWGHQIFLDDSAMVIQHRHRYAKTNSDGSTVPAWSGWATLLDSNNYTETLDGRYVNITGDTMSGDLTAPSVYTSNWFRSTGSTGWYNESYGGGIYMTDSNWVRISHSKKFRTDNTAFIYSYATSSAIPAIVMDKRGSYLVGIGPDDTSNRIKFGPANEGGAFNASWIDIDTFNSNEWYFQGYGVFTNTLTSAYHNFIIGGNEVNFCPDSGTDGALWFNYVSGSSRNSLTKAIHSYYFGNGQKDWNTTHIYAGAVHNAVWNDYAECREAVTNDPGRVLYEQGDDTLSITIERLQHFAGIVSDTYGVIQGETEKAKTPIAVAGRVLAYPYQNRNNYKPGDCVCAAPGGTVDIMTREEIIQYPDRIVGTVSCVPNYEEWGTGKVKINGRIWIKVK